MQIQQLVELADRPHSSGSVTAVTSRCPRLSWVAAGWNDAGTERRTTRSPMEIRQIELHRCVQRRDDAAHDRHRQAFRHAVRHEQLSEVRASPTTAQESGDTFTVDGPRTARLSLGLDLLTIDNTEKTSVTATVVTSVSDGALADDDEITIDIAQIGDRTATGLRSR